MRRAVVLIWLILGGIVMPRMDLAAATERVPAAVQVLPFPRSPRAESIWASDACWSQCQSVCTWDLVGCLQVDAQGHCLQHTDACDRYCQRDCRTRGGPYLPFER
jgi:hypothetical protein